MTPQNNWVSLLLDWFDRSKRELPWREVKPRNPYHVWVSEITLQQTRTETVKEYFIRWIQQFPTVEKLASSEEETVLRAWQGLGYYSRARNLLKAAREIMIHEQGKVPSDPEVLRKLPGIGEYTAGAIASMAYGVPVPAVDGNLLRVLARLYAVRDDVLSTSGKKKIGTLAESVIPSARPGDFNEAMMDLGADICIPKKPRCEKCPLMGCCQAYAKGMTEELPVRRRRQTQKVYYAACLFARQEGRVLLHRCPAKGLLASLWELPTFLAVSEEESRALAAEAAGAPLENPVWSHKHVFTHVIWYMTAYPVVLRDKQFEERGDYCWAAPEDYRRLPLCGPCERFFKDIRNGTETELFR